MGITEDRFYQLASCWLYEVDTNPDSWRWRSGLTPDEVALVREWDNDFEAFLDLMEARSRFLNRCSDHGKVDN